MMFFRHKPRKVLQIGIFIGGPKDTSEERSDLVRLIRDDIEPRFRDISLQTVMWDDPDDPLAFFTTDAAQDEINRELKIGLCQIFIMVFKSRLGSPLELAGKLYPSGSAYEVELALDSPDKTNLAIFCQKGAPPEPKGRGKRERAAWNEATEQYDLLQDYLSQLVKDKKVQNRNEYTELRNLRRQVENLLRRAIPIIEKRYRDAESANPPYGLLSPAGTNPSPTYGENPFRGLGAMHYAHHPVYFGREKDLKLLLEQLKTRDRASLVCVHGPSGVGKSSFMMAGLLPQIIERGMLLGGREWQRIVFHPTEFNSPFASFAAAIVDEGRKATGLTFKSVEQDLINFVNQSDEKKRRDIIDRLLVKPALNGRPDSAKLIVAVDQLEELFTVGTQWRDPFLELLTALSAHPRLSVFCTLRSDVLDEWNSNPLLNELLNGGIVYALQPPKSEQLRSMIVQPAHAAGVDVSEVLEPLLEDARSLGDTSLPMIAYALEVLYAKAPGTKPNEKRLTLELYRQSGDLKGLISQHLEEKLAAGGDSALTQEFTLKEHLDLLFPELVEFKDRRPSRRQVQRAALLQKGAPEHLIEVLVHEARVLAVTGNGQLQLAHEALYQSWDLLKAWIDRNSRLLETLAEIEDDARPWFERGRRARMLKVSRERLAELEGMRNKSAKDAPRGLPRLSDLAHAYLDAAEVKFRREDLVRSVKGGHVGEMVEAYEAGGRLQPEDRSEGSSGLRDPFYHAVTGNWRAEGKSTDRSVEETEQDSDVASVYNAENVFHVTGGNLTPLHIAAALKHIDLVKHLIDKGADPKATSQRGYTTVNSACFGGSLEVVKYLVEQGVDPLIPDNEGGLPFLWAFQRGFGDIVDYLKSQGADFGARSKFGWSALSEAVAGAHIDLVKQMIAEAPQLLQPFGNGFTLLMRCCQGAPKASPWNKDELAAKRLEIADLLLASGVDPKARLQGGWTAAHSAAASGQPAMLRWLHAHGVDINVRDDDGWTPLHSAVSEDVEQLEAIEALIVLGADCNALSNSGGSALMTAASLKHESAIARLLAAGADPNLVPGDGWGALHFAADDGHVPIAKALISAGANVDKTVPPGWTPLMLALRVTRPPYRLMSEGMIRLLIENGADVNLGVRKPLELAIKGGSENLAILLLDKGADPAQVPASPSHVLHDAARHGFARLTRRLIDRGVPVDLLDASGITALAYALANDQMDAARELLDAGADIHAAGKDAPSPIQFAGINPRPRSLELLIEKYPNLNFAAGAGATPLHIAALNGNLETCRWLLAREPALRDMQDPEGQAPLHLAADFNQSNACQLLLQTGATPGCKRADGLTPLHLAARNGHIDACRALVPALQPHIDPADLKGLTPLMAAVARGRAQVCDYLISSGADAAALLPEGSTLLHVAAMSGSAETVQSLVKTQAVDHMKRNDAGQTAMDVAEANGQRALVPLLVAAGLPEPPQCHMPRVSETASFLKFQPFPEAELEELEKRLSTTGPELAISSGRRMISRASLPIYKGGSLIAVADTGLQGMCEQFLIDVPGQDLVLLDWTNDPIYALNDRHPPDLSDDRNAILYALFFFHFVRGQLGTFTFVDTAGRINWTSAADAETKAKVAGRLMPLRVTERPGASQATLRGTVIFKNALFETDVRIGAYGVISTTNAGNPPPPTPGNIVLENEEMVFEDLPIEIAPVPGKFG